MTQSPKQKAAYLIDKFSDRYQVLDVFDGWKEFIDYSRSKTNALIAVEIIINCVFCNKNESEHKNYWKKVKQEIENL